MNTVFIIISLSLFLSLLSGSLYFYKHNNRFVREKSVTIGAILMTIYSLFCIASALLTVQFQSKIILIICGLSPFIIGHYAEYKKLLLFTILQLIIIGTGILYTIFLGIS